MDYIGMPWLKGVPFQAPGIWERSPFSGWRHVRGVLFQGN